MIFAKVDSWLSVLIFVIWGFSLVLEFLRRQKKKAERQEALRQERARQQKNSVEGNSLEELREAEARAREQNYRSVPTGADLEVKLQDLLKNFEYQNAESEDQVFADEIVKVSPPPPKPQEITVPKIIMEHEESHPSSYNKFFPAGLSGAVIASEILQSPLARRRRPISQVRKRPPANF